MTPAESMGMSPEEYELAQRIARGEPREQLMSYFDEPPPPGSVAALTGPQLVPQQPSAPPMGPPRPPMQLDDRMAIQRTLGSTPDPGPVSFPVAAATDAGRKPPMFVDLSNTPGAAVAAPQETPQAPPVAPRPSGPKAPPAPSQLDRYLAENYSGGSDEDAELAAEGGNSEEGPVPGMKTVAERREVAPVKLGALDRAEQDEQRDKVYALEPETIQTDEDAARMQRWAGRITDAKRQEIEKGYSARADDRAAQLREMLAKHDEQAKQITEMGIEEPSLWTGNAGTDIMRAIGIGLMALGKDPRFSLDVINGIIDRQIATQKERIAKKKDDWKNQGLLLDRVGGIYQDDAHRDAAAKELALKGVESTLQRFAAFTQDPAIKARAELALAQARDQRVAAEAKVNAEFADKVVREGRMPPPGTGPNPLQRLKLENEWRKENGWDRTLYVPTAGGYATNAEQHKKMLDAGVVAKNVISGLAKLRHLATDVASSKLPLSKAKADMQATLAYTQGQLKEAEHLGALSASDYEFMNKQIPEVGFTNPQAPAAYESLMQRVSIGHRNQMIESGLIDGPAPPHFRDASAPAGFTPEQKGGSGG